MISGSFSLSAGDNLGVRSVGDAELNLDRLGFVVLEHIDGHLRARAVPRRRRAAPPPRLVRRWADAPPTRPCSWRSKSCASFFWSGGLKRIAMLGIVSDVFLR